MFKELFFRFKFFRLVKVTKKSDSAKITEALSLINREQLTHYRPGYGVKMRVTTYHTNILELTSELDYAITSMRERDYVSKLRKLEKARQITLDDYLTDSRDRAVSFIEGVMEVKRLYTNLFKELEKFEDPQLSYYRRKFNHLTEEVHSLLVCVAIFLKNTN